MTRLQKLEFTKQSYPQRLDHGFLNVVGITRKMLQRGKSRNDTKLLRTMRKSRCRKRGICGTVKVGCSWDRETEKIVIK